MPCPLNPVPDDVFSIFQHSAIKPRLFTTVAATLYLKYSKSQELEAVTVLPRWSDYLDQKSQELGSMEIPAIWKDCFLESSEELKDMKALPYWCSQGQYRETMDVTAEKKFFMLEMNCLESLGKSKINSLRTLRIFGISVSHVDVISILKTNAELKNLVLCDIRLVEYNGTHQMTYFLGYLRDYYTQRKFPNLKVLFQQVRCQDFSGTLSASEQQLQIWMNGEDDQLLSMALSAFTLDSDSSDDSIAGYSDEYWYEDKQFEEGSDESFNEESE
ncbi:hypothetical protein MMC14_006183 [Varicellaria rhodocarpa]|nr:hypothetical protein [Varicellaria rhodocarpa]